MAYIVTRNKKSGYVSMVEKRRVPVAGGKTSVRNVGYVCGLGTMDQKEFEEFRDWAHGITCQETRKATVLACPRVVVTGEKAKAKVAESQQKKTTVKPKRKPKTVWKPKVTVKKDFPVKPLAGYRGKTHTQIMAERTAEYKAKAFKAEKYKKIYVDITPAQRKKFITELKDERIEQRKEYRHWDVAAKQGGLYGRRSEIAQRTKAEKRIEQIDKHLEELEK